ncbi:hypothetical protein SAMN05421636_104405 [Pricia antarctica]|uniref:Uncharacterized protein n=1 Tax=Pricia antarctica TaxID=641691 RepID=A0A1G7C5J3_9FLAO|nr:hypothetical protein SAMN05421636_104405 [Pricia antarctica]
MPIRDHMCQKETNEFNLVHALYRFRKKTGHFSVVEDSINSIEV